MTSLTSYSCKNSKACLPYVLLLFFGVVFLHNCIKFYFTVDDAYISMRYARHLFEGKGLVYNIGQYVEGYSNFLWVIILALFGAIGLNMPIAANIGGIFFSLLTLLLVIKLINKLYPGRGYWNLLPVALLSTNCDFTGWATGGLETALFTFLVFAALYLFYEEAVEQKNRFFISGLLCGILCLTRPEGLLFSGLYFSGLMIRQRYKGNSFFKYGSGRLTVFLAIMIPYVIWKTNYYGNVLPNSFYVKVNKIEYFDRGIRFAASFIKESYAYLWLLPIIFSLTKLNFFVCFVFFQCLVYFIYAIWVGGDWMAYRFYVPIIPPLILLVGVGFNHMLDYTDGIGRTYVRRCLKTFSIIYVLIIIAFNAIPAYMYDKYRKTIFNDELQILNYTSLHLPEKNAIEVAKAFEKVLLPDEVVAGSFAGFTGLYTDIKVIDTLGLNDKYIARLPIQKPGQPGHEKQAPYQYLKEQKAICLYPWPVETPGNQKSQYNVEYAPDKYLTFGSTLPYSKVVRKFQKRGFNVFYRGNFIPDPDDIQQIKHSRNFNFETGTYVNWKVEGKAFGTAPSFKGQLDNSIRINGYEGKFYINSYYNSSDKSKGKLVSDTFVIDGDTISFLIAGGNKRSTSMNLLIDGKTVRSASGSNSEEMVRKYWKVSNYMGTKAKIEIIDFDSGGWGHIVIDDIQIGKSVNKMPKF
jgi:arabinofuranosyltransferase